MPSRRVKAYTQKILLLEMMPVKIALERRFRVLGTTGAIHVVNINKYMSCTCDDNRKHKNICKHIYFILLRVMKISAEEIKHRWDRNELLKMFSEIPGFIERGLCLDDTCKDKFDNRDEGVVGGNNNYVTQRIDDVCPICLDALGSDPLKIDYCKYSCGKSVHKSCYKIWCENNKEIKKCIFCRALWNK